MPAARASEACAGRIPGPLAAAAVPWVAGRTGCCCAEKRCVRLCAGIHDNTLMHVPGSVCALILASAGATGVVPAAQFEDSARLKKLAGAYEAVDKALRAPVEAGATPGIAWGIVVDGELVHTGVAGVREVSSKAPVEARTAFRIASMTKSFTAAAILQLRDTGKLSLEDRVDR